MARFLRISEFWRWLPQFRAVAEREHLGEAARMLHVSPSALSRTIGLLEESVGAPLFHRQGRGLRLTRAGSLFLSSVRSAMRLVDDGLVRATTGQFVGEARASVPSWLGEAAAAALRTLEEAHPDLVPCLDSLDWEQLGPALLAGDLDVALAVRPHPGKQLVSALLAAVPRSLHVGRSHPLFSCPHVTRNDLENHSFVAPLPDERALSDDGWPLDEPRRVGFFYREHAAGVAACRSGAFVGVFPDLATTREVSAGHLRRFALAGLAPAPLFAIRRVQLLRGDLAEAIISALSEAFGVR